MCFLGNSISTPVPDSVLEVSVPKATQGSQCRALSCSWGQQTSSLWAHCPCNGDFLQMSLADR